MAMTTIAAGLSVKKPGSEQYSSDGCHLSVEVQTEIADSAQFKSAVAALFAEVRTALDAELSGGQKPARALDVWAGNVPSPEPVQVRRDPPSEKPPASRRAPSARKPENADTPDGDTITNAQARFLLQLARRHGMKTQTDIAGWLSRDMGVSHGLYELTRVEASKAIDALNTNGAAKR